MLINRILAFNFLQSYINTLTLTNTNAIYDLIPLPLDPLHHNSPPPAHQTQHPPLPNRRHLVPPPSTASTPQTPPPANPCAQTPSAKSASSAQQPTPTVSPSPTPCTSLAAPSSPPPSRPSKRTSRHYPGVFNPKRALQDPAHPKVTDISPEVLNFGLGRPACLGRWFASCL
ncbi:MAG: hypothetical protein M1831_003791 [Alyxoria varia]|nr:MAG: hypothetical protein M1831_003791 [Alyxoria varia]